MSVPNLELNETPSPETTDPIDPSQEGVTVESANPPAPATPQIDFAALYRESLAERRRMEEENERLRQQYNKPPQNDIPEVTDEYFEKHGTAKGVQTIVESTVAKLLRESLGDVGELSKTWKRDQQISQAEEQFYRTYPHLAQYREQLSQTVRPLVANEQVIDPRTYERNAFAAIGFLSVNGMTQQPPAAPANGSSAPTSAPVSRTAPPVRTPVRRISEFERNAMRQAGYDPNKPESVEEFFRIVESDEGVTVL